MSFVIENVACSDRKLEKHLGALRKPAKRAKDAVVNMLTKSENRLKNEAKSELEEEKKNYIQKKIDNILRNITLLQDISEDDIITFAITTKQNLMAVAANKRLHQLQRLKARIACHKPLSTHLSRVKKKLDNNNESDSEGNKSDTSGTLNKICINNQIVKMRGLVKKAKVHIIHKLTRNINMFRKSKMKEKFEKKIERLVNKVKCIKELRPDEISRFALTTTGDLNKVAYDINSSLRTQSMATVAIHKFVTAAVADFKSKFPDSHVVIPKILAKKKKKRKIDIEAKGTNKNTESKNKLIKELEHTNEESEVRSLESDSYSENENNTEEDGSEKSIEGDDSDGGNSSEESNEGCDENEIEHSDRDNDSEIYTKEELSKSSDLEVNYHNDNNILVSKKVKLKNKKMLSEGHSDINKTNISIVSENVTKKKEKIGKKHVSKPLKDGPKVVDPFFVTATNEEYVTSQTPAVSKDNLPNWRSKDNTSSLRKADSFVRTEKSRHWIDKDKERMDKSFNRWQNKPYNKPLGKPFEKDSNSGRQGMLLIGNRKQRRQALRQPVQEEKPEKLHPSWEAKKKLPSIASFQGKKVIFD